jgi:hypothetical protein
LSILKAAVAIVLLLTTVPAHADWRATRWGMSETEAAAAVPDSAPADPSDVQSYSNGEGRVGLVAPYRTSEFGFRVFLRFAPNGQGLSSVLLLLDDAKEQGPRLRDALTDRYGEPQLRPLTAYTVLGWETERDIIRLIRTRDDFWSLTYVDKALPLARGQQGPPQSDGL